jgi:hypothetical protein
MTSNHEPPAEALAGITQRQQGELRAMLDRLARLWSELTIAAVARITNERVRKWFALVRRSPASGNLSQRLV